MVWQDQGYEHDNLPRLVTNGTVVPSHWTTQQDNRDYRANSKCLST